LSNEDVAGPPSPEKPPLLNPDALPATVEMMPPCPLAAVTVRVTPIVLEVTPGAWTVILPWKVPTARPLAFTRAVRDAGITPDTGDTLSHAPPVDVVAVACQVIPAVPAI
jgi:hypothetical protein